MKRLLLLLVAGLALVAGCGDPVYPAAQVQPVLAPPVVTVAAPVQVEIPALHVSDNLVPVGLADGELELPDVHDTGWYDLAPRPGQLGRAVLAGHVNYDGVPGALGTIGKLHVGDLITTTAADGVASTFAVYAVYPKILKADYTTKTVPLVFGRSTGAELALVTCSGKVINHSYDSNAVVLARAI